MSVLKTIPRFLACLLAAGTLGGCSWLGDEPQVTLRPSTLRDGVWVWPRASLDAYHRFTVDVVAVNTPEGIEMNTEVRREIAAQLRREIVVRLANRYEVVEPGGAGVMRLSVVVHGVRPGVALGLAGAWLEAHVSDSVTQAPLLDVLDERSHVKNVSAKPAPEWELARDVMISWAEAIQGEVLAAAETD